VVANQSQTRSGPAGKPPLLPLRSKRVYVAGPAAAGLTAALQPDLGATGGRIVASPGDAQVIVAAAVLTGQLRPAGRLPVAIPAVAGGIAFRYGTGLSY